MKVSKPKPAHYKLWKNSLTNIRGNPNGPSQKNLRTFIAKPHLNNGGQAHEHENKINELQLQLNELRQAQDQNQKTHSQAVKNNTNNNLKNNRNNYYNNKNIMTNNNKNPEGNGHTFSQQKKRIPAACHKGNDEQQ